MSRMTGLLEAAANALEEGRDPFETSFLVEHQVALGECIDLGQQIASFIRAYLRLPTEGKALMLMAAANDAEKPFTTDQLMGVIARQHQSRTLDDLIERIRNARVG